MFFRKKRFNPHKVTPLSKALALILFIAMPFIGFCLGIRYQKLVDSIELNRLRGENEVLKSIEYKLDAVK